MGDCHDKALELVARRPHFRRELEQKLVRRGFSSDEVESTLVELARIGLLDDLAHAREMAGGSMARKSFGPRRMRAEFMRRGVEETVIDMVIADVFSDPEEEFRRARDAAHRRSEGGAADLSRVGRFLDRKGFSKSVILRVLEEFEPG